MRKRFHLSRRRRVVWTGVALFCLVFQQLAMAAYVCTLPLAPVATAMAGHCAEMGMAPATPASAPDQQGVDPRCAAHCAGHAVTTHDASLPTVPPLLLPALPPALLGAAVHPADRAALPDLVLRRSDPPPILRFCSLLI